RVRQIVATLADSDEGQLHLSTMYPFSDTDTIRALLVEVDEFTQSIRFDDPLPRLSIHDIRGLFPKLKIEGYNLGIEGIAAVADNLELARIIRQYFKERIKKYPVLWKIADALTPHEEVENQIRKTITPDLTIADDASPELRSIRRRYAKARNSLRELIEKTLAEMPDEIIAERIVTIRNGRFVIPIRDSMKKRVQGAVHDRSQTGKTLFIEPLASIEGNNLVCELEMAERAELERILVKLTAQIAEIAEDIKRNQEILVRMDIIKAKAQYGIKVDGVIPHINDVPTLSIRKGRHPLLDWKYRKQDDRAGVIPLDVDLDDSIMTIVITGPNAGGKTVALKTVGLLTIMALSGIPVPAGSNTTIFPPSGIFADIGDEQSIDNDLSTFSSHMKQIVTILREAGSGALVLLDELGGGTNPAEGEAIALAVLKKLTNTGALTIATTHHGGLKIFAHETEGVINASLEFDNVNLRPTFVYRTGVPGSSYAFEIASRLGMPEKVLQEAESLVGGERKSLESLIADMEEHVRRAEEERKAVAAERNKMEAARKEYEQKYEEITSKKHELLSEALAESQKIIEETNRRIESAIKMIRETGASRESIKEAKSQTDRIVHELQQIAASIPEKKKDHIRKPLKELRQGITVWAESLESDAVVEEVLDNGKKARIRVGKSSASVVVNTEDLFEGVADAKKRNQEIRVKIYSHKDASREIDLRGMTFDEAREELDMFLERLKSSGFESGYIIHGKGTGALRKKISSYLNDQAYVESYRLGNWNEGSTGVTVVTLKKD
ncbi:MAG TPA: endonuclease MutS2, partial [Anaerolineae bacterium]|nr:endonuclease MutS2 [Anaerolineae bacterium]